MVEAILVTLARGLGFLSPTPFPHFRLKPHLPQYAAGKLSSLLLCLKAGMTDLSPQVHARGGAGLRGAGAAHPGGRRGGGGRGRPAS